MKRDFEPTRPGDEDVPGAEALRALVESSHEPLAASDGAGRLHWANARFRDATGADAGSRLRDLACPGDEGEAARAAIDHALAGDGHAAERLAFLAFDGTTLWLDLRAVRSGDEWLWTFRDRTAERFLAGQARRQGELLDTAQEFGRLGLWERRIPSGEGRWDRHVFRFWGLDPKDGTPAFEDAAARIHPEDRPNFIYRASTESAGRYAQRYRVVHPDGTVSRIHSQWEVKNGPDGRPDRAVGVMMDDTEVYAEASALGDVGSQLKLAVELGQIAIWRHDLKTQRMYYNDRAFDVLQMPPRSEGLPIEEVRSYIHPDDLPRVIESAERALHSAQPTDMEARYRRRDGSWRTVMTRRVVERDAAGAPIAFVGVALDVTESVEQRRRADQLSSRLEAASRSAGIGIWSTGDRQAETNWSAQMFALFDRFEPPQPPTIGRWLREGVHEVDRDRIARAAIGFLRGGAGPLEIEFRTPARDGGTRWIVMRADVDASETSRRRLVGVALDVTEHHAALEALRDASERTRLITRYAGIGTWEARPDGSEAWDEQMFALRGLPARARPLTRDERLALVHPDDLPLVLDSAGDRAPHGPAAYEFRIRLPDGRWRWLASRSAAVLGEGGRIERRVGVNWDVTEAKEAERARQQAALAEREIQAKSQFLSRMSHELRTPLNAVLGFTQLLQVEAQRAGQPAQAGKLGHIRRAADHLLSLINDVLDLTGLESGELKLAPQPLELAELVRESLPLVEPLAAQHDVTIETAALAGRVQADPTRLRQVLVNLLSNAVKYNRHGGRVFVGSEATDDGGVLWVRDTGRGFSRDQLKTLFEPFNRFGVEREGIEGTGIGLVIAKTLVDGMGGTIEVTSDPGAGSTFRVALPPASGAPAAATVAAPVPELPAGEARGGTILYIEDNAVNVLLVEELVKTAGGIALASEPTGRAGVERARILRPDLVLVDLQLPDIDGYAVLRQLRADPSTRAIPCIALSANAMPDDIARGLAAGFAEYWTKPIDFGVFLGALGRLFPAETAQP